MAQILKEEFRQAIIDSAKQEFLEKGYEDASMRNIAKNAGMTVGNLYRYFPSKDDIQKSIVSETMEEIDDLLRHLTANSVSMEARVFSIKANVDDLHVLMNTLAERIVEIYLDHPQEFNILMMQSKLNNDLTDWFSNAINSLIEQHFLVPGFRQEKEILSHSYAVSIFTGMKEIFSVADRFEDAGRLTMIVKTYLNSYVSMLDSDIRRQVF